jgi:site-specific DNA-cytosine methylase
MKVLELFSGTGSIGKACEDIGYESISVDISADATHKCDIMDFDYKQYPKDTFDIVWASCPCTEFSKAKTRGIRDIEGANKLVLKTLEIIDYFDCEYWFIENPQTGKLKEQTFMKDFNYYDGDYCMYGKTYRKRTRIWTNRIYESDPLKLCNKKCGSFVNGKHIGSCGNGRKKYTDKAYSLNEKYSMPPDFIYSLFLGY